MKKKESKAVDGNPAMNPLILLPNLFPIEIEK